MSEDMREKLYKADDYLCELRDIVDAALKQNTEIARLTERCDAYQGQVKAGDEQIQELRRCRDAYREALRYAYDDAMPAEAELYYISGVALNRIEAALASPAQEQK